MCSCPRRVGALWLKNIDAVFDLGLRGRVTLLEWMWVKPFRCPSRKDSDWDVETWCDVPFQHECHRFLEGDKEHMSVCLLASYYLSLSPILKIHPSKYMCVCVYVCIRQRDRLSSVFFWLVPAELGGQKTYGPSVQFFPLHSFSFSSPLVSGFHLRLFIILRV